MSQLKSVFGAYADKMQLLINNSLQKFAPIFWKRYFTWAPPQSTLTYVSALGAARIEAAASIVDRDAPAPSRGRPALSKLTGEIPSISEKFRLSQNDYFDFLNIQNMSTISGGDRTRMLLDMMFNDVLKAGQAPHKRLDYMVLEGISTGNLTLTVTNNPDGLVEPVTIDLLMPSGNKMNSATSWDNVGAHPFTVDFPAIVAYATSVGIQISRALMSRELFAKFIAITEVQNLMSNFVGAKQAGTILPTLANINNFLSAQLWPPIEIVDEVIGIEKDGVITTYKPFNQNNVAFVPAGQLGTMKNAIAVEQRVPAEQVSYATFDRVLISKWHTNDPWSEFTKCELNAIPSFENINSEILLTAVH